MGWKHWDEGKFIAPLLKTGQVISYHAGDDGDLQLGIAPSFTVLTTGRHSGTVNLTINGDTHATSNACVQDKNTGLMWHREVIQSDLGPAGDGKFFWEQYTLGPKIDISFVAATKVINSVAGEFNTGACCVGRKITISGAAQGGNNQDITVAGITANDMTVNEVLVNEGAGASVSFATVDDLIWDLKDQANAANLAGYSDWRIPNLRELMSITNIGICNPAIDGTAFPSTPTGYFWTNSTDHCNSTRASTVWLERADIIKHYKKTIKNYIRLVR